MGSVYFCNFIFWGEVSGLVRELRRHKSIGRDTKETQSKRASKARRDDQSLK